MNGRTIFNFKSLVLSAALMTLVGCNTISVRGSGPSYEERHDFTSIHTVTVKGTGQLQIENGDSNVLIVSAQEQLHEHLIVRQIGQQLIIQPEEGYSFEGERPIHYTLITNDIDTIDVRGAVTISSESYTTDSLVIDASGATDVDMVIFADSLTIDASGSFDGYLAGNTDELILDFSGSSDLNAYDLTANEVDIDISGASTTYVNARDRLNVSAAGASHVSYKGNPRVSQSSAGASSVSAAQEF